MYRWIDELIAVYHDCTDRTPEILRQKAAQYPDKIRVFEYQPSVYPIDLDEEELEKAKLLPPDSIHTLAGYCNYALSKASYRYAVKIDADQVYFTDRLKHICDAYRSDKKCGSTWRNVSLTTCIGLMWTLSIV